MTVAGYWESVFNKTKVLFRVLAKETQTTFILDSGNNCKMNYGPTQKNVLCLKHQTEKTPVEEWNESMNN